MQNHYRNDFEFWHKLNKKLMLFITTILNTQKKKLDLIKSILAVIKNLNQDY